MVEFLRQEYLDSRSALVQTFKSGRKKGQYYVTKISVKERHPLIKDDLAKFVLKHPEVLEAYKSRSKKNGFMLNGLVGSSAAA
jgi:hypothetical protein